MPPLTCSPLHGKRDWLPYTAYHESWNESGSTHYAPGFCFPGFLIIKMSSHFGKPFNEVRISGIESPFSMPPSHARRCTEKGLAALYNLSWEPEQNRGYTLCSRFLFSGFSFSSKCHLILVSHHANGARAWYKNFNSNLHINFVAKFSLLPTLLPKHSDEIKKNLKEVL